MERPTELPDLDPGVRLLETDVRGALHALVVDQVLQRRDERDDGTPPGGGDARSGGEQTRSGAGRALWADAGGRARTRAIADVAPDRRVLRRISVARGFTAYQHYAIVEALAERALGAAGGDAAADRESVALLVAPAIDAPYRDDGLRGEEGRAMLVRALATLAGVARTLAVPVLVTRTADDELAAPVANAARSTIACERTPMGPRFATDEFETLVYPAGDGLVQTTLAFWQRVLERRRPDGALGDAGAATAAGASEAPPSAPLRSEPAATGQPAIVRGEPVATPTASDPTRPGRQRSRTEVLARGPN